LPWTCPLCQRSQQPVPCRFSSMFSRGEAAAERGRALSSRRWTPPSGTTANTSCTTSSTPPGITPQPAHALPDIGELLLIEAPRNAARPVVRSSPAGARGAPSMTIGFGMLNPSPGEGPGDPPEQPGRRPGADRSRASPRPADPRRPVPASRAGGQRGRDPLAPLATTRHNGLTESVGSGQFSWQP
jgi:hypothetical protein